jgi:SM-20-related protein
MNYENLYSKITDALVDDGCVIIENALDKNLCSSLLAFSKTQKSFKKAGISGFGYLHFDSTKRRDKTLWIDENTLIQRDYLSFSNGLKKSLNKELYLGLSYYESHFAIYDEGDFYEKHLDAFKNSKNRVVTTVYYLNDAWKKSDGGELIIYDEDDKFLAKVTPNANTLVVFLSDKFPHEVLPAKKKRYSIAGWFRMDR